VSWGEAERLLTQVPFTARAARADLGERGAGDRHADR
jgi:hypothetical protein